MQNIPQKTLKKDISFSGRGLHSFKKSKITLKPAPPNTGIIFRKLNTKDGSNTLIPATWQNIKPLPLCTCIKSHDNDNIYIRTIEHLLAALYACEIDNTYIDINGAELPILDGSAYPFFSNIYSEITEQPIPKTLFKILKPVEFHESKKRWIKIEPSDQFEIDISIHLQHLGKMNWAGTITPEIFRQEILKARTFGRLKNGLLARLTCFNKDPICLGANLSTSLVFVGNKAINKNGMRMPDEPIKHRVLDLIGDLMLAGGQIQGRITANSTAHRLNQALLKKIFTDQSAFKSTLPPS